MREIIQDKLAPSIPKLEAPTRLPKQLPSQPLKDNISQARPTSTKLPYMISFRVHEDLLSMLHHAVQAAKDGGNFQFQSVSEVFRASLQAYVDGMPLIPQPPTKSPKRATSCVLSDELKASYDALPTRSRSQIIERATRAFLQHGLVWPS